MSSGDLEKSLRADIDGYVNGRLSSLQEEVMRLQSQFNEAFTRLAERMEGDTQQGAEASIAVAVAEHMRNARNEGIERAAAESTRARASSDIAIIKAAIDDLDNQRSQSDILSTLVNRAAAFAPRVAFFVIKNDRATGWRARGLEGTVGDDAVRELSLPLSSDTLLAVTARARQTWSGGPGSHASDHEIYNHFGDEPPQRVVAVPMVAREKTVAVLYADSAGQDSDAVNLEAIESLVRVAGMAVELLATKRPAPTETRNADLSSTTSTASSSTASTPAPPPAQPAAQPHAASYTEPVHAENRSQAFEAQPSGFEAQEASSYARSAPPEAAPASGSFASTDAVEMAPDTSFAALSEPASPPEMPQAEVSPLGTTRRYGAADMEFPVEVAEEEKRYHNEARRFARLLVSEIKLYNEQKVQEGRTGGDLYNRLREDIDRSRQMYDKRVRPEVSARYDYFHHELVNALAEGDSDKLGDGYPGATASM